MSHTEPYYLEIETDGREYSGCQEGYGWLNYGTIIASGFSLEECLDEASVDIVDQDGGNPRFSPIEADSEWMQALITKEFLKKYPTGCLTRAQAERLSSDLSDWQVLKETNKPDLPKKGE